jgi:hypothetical protein
MITLLALLMPVLASTLAGHSSFTWLAELASNKTLQRNALIISTLFIAPFISLAWTMLEIQKK